MAIQLSLFNPPKAKQLFQTEEPDFKVPEPVEPKKLARRTDPETSHKAAEEMVAKLAGVQLAVLAAVQDWPGYTARELAKELGWDVGSVNKRLPELETANLVVRGDPRTCRESGKSAAIWTAVLKNGSRV